MDDIEKIEFPDGATAKEIGLIVHDRYDEIIAADVADLLVQGFTLDQIVIEEPTWQIIKRGSSRNTLRLTSRVVGRRVEIVD